jgi:hypothetical protein
MYPYIYKYISKYIKTCMYRYEMRYCIDNLFKCIYVHVCVENDKVACLFLINQNIIILIQILLSFIMTIIIFYTFSVTCLNEEINK